MRLNTIFNLALLLVVATLGTEVMACSIQFTSPSRGSTVSTATVNVSGTASGFANTGNVGTASATVNGASFFNYTGTFTTALNFFGSGSATATLQPGLNVLFVTGSVSGCSASDSMIVYYTPPPPPEQKNAGEPSDCNDTNPINGATGNKFQAETDFIDPSYKPLQFVRYYNSAYTVARNLGKGWRSNYDNQLIVTATTAYIIRADGMAYRFTKPGSSWIPEGDINDKLENVTISGVAQFKFTRGKDNGTEFYTANGRLSSMADLDGRTLLLDYDALGHLASVTDQHSGRKLQFTYNATHKLASIIDARGNTYSYQYADNIHLTSVTYPNSPTPAVREYKYNEAAYTSGANLPDALTGIIDENGSRFATFSYDTLGRATVSEHANGIDRHNLVYNTDGTTTVSDAQSAARIYGYQTILNVKRKVSQNQPAGSGCAAASSALTYDTNGNIASRTDFNGNKTTYVYDMTRNLEASRTEGLTTAGGATPATRTITTTWHATWRLPLVISEYAGATATGTPFRRPTTSYDDKGNVTSVTEEDPARGLSRTTTTTYTYSTAVPGLILEKTVDGPLSGNIDQSRYYYYPHDATCAESAAEPIIDPVTLTSPPNYGCRGQLERVIDKAGLTTGYERYNHHGQVELWTDANGVYNTYSYDLRQRLTRITVENEETAFTYDDAGLLKKATFADGSALNYIYDNAHRLTEISNNLGDKVIYTLDDNGNRTNEQMFNGSGTLTKTITRQFDALNRAFNVTGE